MMSEAEPASLAEDALEKVMEKIDSQSDMPAEKEIPNTDMPFSIEKLMQTSLTSKNWKRLSSSVDVARFQTGQDQFEVALHKICAGGKTPKHDHDGLEYTVVLKGSFSDEEAVYREGDFILRQPGDVHQPMGAQNGECICLSALSAPIRPTSPLGFLMKPWLRINPR